ncbi:hypothetical protein ACFV7R_16175 [Streptomyces sp. NPDC059866]|uniref:hypothetical protein n=1 Tax=Streptomyces sp. NPDC059866 TaxID=3346978 RepID=UPI0036636777
MRDLLYVLPVLACPLGMGLMMWMMMRPGRRTQPKDADHPPYVRSAADQPQSPQDVAALREEIADLRAELDRRSGQASTVERTP